MDERLVKIFQKNTHTPPLELGDQIWQKIVARNEKISKIKFWGFSSLGFISLLGTMPALKMLTEDLSQSGIYEYLSLAFYDSSILLSYYQEISASLAEALPLMSTIIFLSLVFMFFWSLRYATRQINPLFTNPISRLSI